MGQRAKTVAGLRRRFFLDEIPDRGLVLLPGIRGVGKSVALLQLFSQHDGYLAWIDELRLFYGKGIRDLLREAERREDSGLESLDATILLDEVHYDPEWAGTLKWLADIFRGRIVATGSSALAFELTPELARRARVLWVWPLSFYEWLHLRGEDIRPVRIEDVLFGDVEPEYRPGFERFLMEGGLPVTLELGIDAVMRSVERVIFSDLLVTGGFDRRTLSLAPRVVRELAIHPWISVERIASEVGLSKPTVIALLDSLERAGLIIQLRPFGPRSSIRKGLRRYFVTPTIRYSLTRPDYDYGLLMEEYAASLLYHLALRRGWELTFWPGEGPDFVLIAGARKIAVEVGIGRKGGRQVRMALDRVDEGIVISEEGPKREGRVRWVPLASFYRGY